MKYVIIENKMAEVMKYVIIENEMARHKIAKTENHIANTTSKHCAKYRVRMSKRVHNHN